MYLKVFTTYLVCSHEYWFGHLEPFLVCLTWFLSLRLVGPSSHPPFSLSLSNPTHPSISIPPYPLIHPHSLSLYPTPPTHPPLSLSKFELRVLSSLPLPIPVLAWDWNPKNRASWLSTYWQFCFFPPLSWEASKNWNGKTRSCRKQGTSMSWTDFFIMMNYCEIVGRGARFISPKTAAVC